MGVLLQSNGRCSERGLIMVSGKRYNPNPVGKERERPRVALAHPRLPSAEGKSGRTKAHASRGILLRLLSFSSPRFSVFFSCRVLIDREAPRSLPNRTKKSRSLSFLDSNGRRLEERAPRLCPLPVSSGSF